MVKRVGDGGEPTPPAKSVRHEGQGTLAGMWLLTDAITDYGSQVALSNAVGQPPVLPDYRPSTYSPG